MVSGINSYLNQFGYGVASGATGSPQIFDFKAVQKQTQSLLSSFKADNNRVKSLKDDSAKFLDTYTKRMNSLGAAADKVRGTSLRDLLYTKDGSVTESTVGNTVGAVKGMVEQYNSSLKMLNDNADRGSGVTKQIGRMASDPAPEASMKMIGFTVNKDGTLVLDEEKLTAALTDETPGQRKLAEDIIGGNSGLAQGVRNDASMGARRSAASLIENDLYEMQSIRSDDTLRSMFTYSRSGAYSMNNLGAMGMFMNFLT